eukprot:CAMPEP_0114996454 /NCGR_PEP_ID=MMETSP0216-20121206/14318_1 /TAXON_ID=223996 /ORGANISM="Protocruzia adherens, Strain Boccale" /LENGTH=587 /DNA_ID=CAMNT_0002360657 /DNA_START=155 /DNA_END=1918 /DNA_ORIENTATION=+
MQQSITSKEPMLVQQEGSRKSPWLSAWNDPVAGLRSFSSCIRLADIKGDGDNYLIMADVSKKLRVYKGTQVLWETRFTDIPVAVAVFYPEDGKNATPFMAVACENKIFMYNDCKAYFVFKMPPMTINSEEQDSWAEFRQGKIDLFELCQYLHELREGGVTLSNRSCELLSYDNPDLQSAFADSVKNTENIQYSTVTCMEVIKKSADDEKAVSMLVVGVENKQIVVLDTKGAPIIATIELQGIPVFMATSGLYSVSYRIVVACRDGKIYTIRNGEVLATVIELESYPAGLVRYDNAILVGTMENVVHAYHPKGKKLYSIHLPYSITNMELLEMTRTKTIKALLVSMSNGEIRLYNEKTLISTLKLSDVILGMRFGVFGREEGSLILSTRSGGIVVKMLQRQAHLERSGLAQGPPAEQDIPLSIPKKTKLYVEQTQRERDQGIEMHRAFQRDLCKLRVQTARAYVKMLSDGNAPMSYTLGTQIRLTAQVHGLGPIFKLKLEAQNTGKKAVQGIPVALAFNHNIYRVEKKSYTIPLLVPGILYHMTIPIECIDENGAAEPVKIFLCNPESSIPLITAIVNMPNSELALPE